jgi:hypothetical protein
MLDKEFKYYLKNQSQLVEKYNGKYIVIKNNQVIGAYNSHKEAFSETIKSHKLGTFLIQLCTPGSEAYTQKFYSRVII